MLLSKSNNLKMEEIRNFVPVSSSSDFDSLAPHITIAERDYLIPVIGKELYDQLHSFYQAPLPAVPTEAEQKTIDLLRLVQSALIHLSYWIGFDLLNAHISDGGFKRTESTTVKSLFKYQEDKLKLMFRTNGFNGIDAILKYLEENIAYFDSFSGSSAYTIMKSAFIPSTALFNEIVFINNSRLTFLRMRAHMQLIEDTEIAPLLGPVTFDLVKAECQKALPDTKVMALLPFIQKPIAFLASALLIQESGADLTDNGLYFSSTIAGFKNDNEVKPASTDRINALYLRNRAIGNAYLDQLRSYLTAHAADWPSLPQSAGKTLHRDNTNRKTFWS